MIIDCPNFRDAVVVPWSYLGTTPDKIVRKTSLLMKLNTNVELGSKQAILMLLKKYCYGCQSICLVLDPKDHPAQCCEYSQESAKV